MATTNAEIILGAMMLAELDPETVIVDTYAGWSRKGYQVKKGETAVFKTKIWKPSKFAVKTEDSQETPEVAATEDGTDTPKSYTKLILVPAAFFTHEQVEKKQKGTKK